MIYVTKTIFKLKEKQSTLLIQFIFINIQNNIVEFNYMI